MKEICLILLLVICVFAHNADQEWKEFKTKFNKQYSLAEDARRYKIFLQNKDLISEHNKKYENGEVTFKMGINKFADMLLDETSYLRGYKESPIKSGDIRTFNLEDVSDYPDTVDWRDQGYVTGVKDQGQCGSCWAFSATGGLEGQNFAATGILVSLSEQNLVDCVEGNDCNGGYMFQAFNYVQENGGIDTEESYPYTAQNGVCQYDPANIGGTCSGYVLLSRGNETELLAAVATIGPITVGMDASHMSFQLYDGGVYYEEACRENFLDHGVLAVGYGNLDGDDYWLVKNSWGTSWGVDGYVYMARNRDNNCGIATSPSYPLV